MINFIKRGACESTIVIAPTNTFTDNIAELLCNIQSAYNDMERIVLTDSNKTEKMNQIKSTYIIPSKSNGQCLIDTSQLSSLHSLFMGFTNLKYAPMIDTSNATTGMWWGFSGCKNLEYIPEYDTTNWDGFEYFAQSCSNLNDESLNNIMAMCIKATKIEGYRSLKEIGLTRSQTNKCKNLSNYAALIEAGWETGY